MKSMTKRSFTSVQKVHTHTRPYGTGRLSNLTRNVGNGSKRAAIPTFSLSKASTRINHSWSTVSGGCNVCVYNGGNGGSGFTRSTTR